MANKQQREIYKENKENLAREQAAASFFKAQWEKMYYFLECEKLMPEYAALIQAKYPKEESAVSAMQAVEQPESIVTTAQTTV